MKKRKEAFDDGKDIQFHRFKSANECAKLYDRDGEALQDAKRHYAAAVKKMEHLRGLVNRTEHEWLDWARGELMTEVEDKVKKNIMLRRRKIANIKGWRRPWDGREGKDYEDWRTGPGSQWHPKFLDDIPKTESDEESGFSLADNDGDGDDDGDKQKKEMGETGATEGKERQEGGEEGGISQKQRRDSGPMAERRKRSRKDKYGGLTEEQLVEAVEAYRRKHHSHR